MCCGSFAQIICAQSDQQPRVSTRYQEIDSNQAPSMQNANQETWTDLLYLLKHWTHSYNTRTYWTEIWILQLCIGPVCVLVLDLVHTQILMEYIKTQKHCNLIWFQYCSQCQQIERIKLPCNVANKRYFRKRWMKQWKTRPCWTGNWRKC